MKSRDFLIVKREKNLAVRALAANNVKKRKTYVANAVFAFAKGRNGKSCVDTRKECLNYSANRNRNGIEGCALALNNSCARLANVFFNLCLVKLGVNTFGAEKRLTVILNGNVTDVCKRPGNEAAVAVFTENVSVNVLLVYVVVFRNSRTKSGSIENSTRADNAFGGKTRILAEGVGEYINGVTYNNVGSVGCVFGDLGNDLLGDVNVDLREVESGLTGLSCNA